MEAVILGNGGPPYQQIVRVLGLSVLTGQSSTGTARPRATCRTELVHRRASGESLVPLDLKLAVASRLR